MYWKPALFAVAIALGGSLAAPTTVCAQLGSAGLFDEQSSHSGAVSGNGASVIKRTPQLLRMKIELSAKGKTLKEALANLKTERESALAKLTKLEVDKATLNVGSPRIAAAGADRQSQMQMMVRQRMQQGGKKPKKPVAPPVTVQSLVTAEWKLAGADPEAMLLESRALEDNIRGAKLANTDKGELSPEDEEAAEEAAAMQEQMSMYDDGSQPKPGEPLFIYVAKISPEDIAKALADAFAKSKNNAAELSKAAGSELGPLKGLAGSSTTTGAAGFNSGGRYNRYVQQMMMGGMGGDDGETVGAPNEAIGAGPQEVSLTVMVNAQFALRNPGSAASK